MARHQTGDAVRITTASRSAAEDIAARQKRYIVAMGFRTVCFVSAIFVTITWARILLVIAALVLPYVAVVMANAGASKSDGFALVNGAIRRQGAAERPWFRPRFRCGPPLTTDQSRARLDPEVPDSFPRGCPALPASTNRGVTP